jgi:hypothetical protein
MHAPWDCAPCRELGTGTTVGCHTSSGDAEDLLPPVVKRLEPAPEFLLRCPECATYYARTLRTDADAGGAWVDVDVERMPPALVRKRIGDRYPECEAILAAAAAALRERKPDALPIAVDWMVDHFARTAKWDEIERLLVDADTTIRDAALPALLRWLYEAKTLPPRIVSALEPLSKVKFSEFGPIGRWTTFGEELGRFKLAGRR